MAPSLRIVALVLALTISTLFARDAAAAAGETGFAFLKLGVGARPMGMGSAYVAIADDATATYWNPAGLASLNGTQITAMHNEWIQDFRQEFVAVGTKFGPGAIGFSFVGFYTTELERRTDTGVLTGHFGFNDVAITGAYGLNVTHGLDVGVGARYLREMIDVDDASTVIFDLGGRYRVADTGLALAVAAQNLGGDPVMLREKTPLPTNVRAGAAFSRPMASLHGKGTLTAEVRKARAEDARFHLGGEFDYKERVALRIGGKFGYDEEDLSFGLGFTQSRIRLDYALVPLSSDLGTTHFFSLSARL
ncbi:MAG TPA: PorV/PorQ family protein [Candidatus Eisenbacteria bacterium]|nr:PorV/PorQ family protein [Candidatus Eisenbacteria bacterium]